MTEIHDLNLHDLHLQDLQNPHHPSSYEEHEDYQVLVLRLPENLIHKPKMHSYGFIVHNFHVYYYDKEKDTILSMDNDLNGFYTFLDQKIDLLMSEIDQMQEKTILLEESLYRRISSRFMEKWHTLKKELSRSERVILKAVDTLEKFITKNKSSSLFPVNEFNDLHEHLERTLRSNISANDQLDNLYQYYNLRSNDRMNRSIYVLTVISVIFLPLNLVVGFFGMNTGGLPFQHTPYGTMYAFTTMIVFGLLLSVAVIWKIKQD